MDLTTLLHPRRPVKRARTATVRLHLEPLEARNLLSVNVQSTFRGMSFTGTEPPDTIAAAGPNAIVETVNSSVAFYEKSTGNRYFQQDQTVFFRPLGGVLNLSDSVVAYDELTGRFVIGVLDFNFTNRSRFDFAVSVDSEPSDGFRLMRYNMDDGVGGFDFADYPRIGYNADAYVLSFNMFPGLDYFDHVDTLAIDKNTLAGFRVQVPGWISNFTMAPSTMHGSQPADSMWFVQAAISGGSTIGVVQMNNVLSNAPTYTNTDVPVPFYSFPPFAPQPFSPYVINTDDHRIINSAMASRQIVAAHTTFAFDGTGGLVAHARWYQFDTTGDQPVLVQMGDIDQGPGVFTFYPSIELNTVGDVGMTFMESSSSEYMSMYVTGRKNADPINTMQTPVLTHAGGAVYTGGRAGDFSGTTVDPVDGTTFWSANEFRPPNSFWGTGIASFTISSATAPPTGVAPGSSAAVLLLETAATAKATPNSLPAAVPSPVPPMPTELEPAVVDWLFNLTKDEKQELVSSGLNQRSLPLKDDSGPAEVTAKDMEFWDRVSPL